MSQIPIGWLVEGFVAVPLTTGFMMIDGIPVTGTSIFTKRTLLQPSWNRYNHQTSVF